MATEHTDNKTVTQGWAETQRTGMILPFDVYEALRRASFDQRIPQQQIVADALRAHLGMA